MKNIIVTKYGGSSITSTNNLDLIKKITLDDNRRKVIVLSAPGKINNKDEKVTDLLIQLGKTKDESIIQIINHKYKIIYQEDVSDKIQERFNLSLNNDAYLDSLKSLGEELNAKLLSKKLNFEYVDPKELFLVSENFGNAKILDVSENMIKNRLKENKIYVIPGFFGYTKNKNIATFSRGGSDLTGAYIASSLESLLYENFTDQEGILAANPEIVDNPKKIDEITFKEMRDLSYSGFNIFHQEALAPLAKKKIPIHVRKTINYPIKGTFIVDDRISDINKPIIGIAYKNNFCMFNIYKMGLDDENGIEEKILRIFSKNKLSIMSPPAEIDDISVILDQNQLKDNVVNTLKKEIYETLHNDGEVNFEDNLGVLVLSGKGLNGNIKILADIQTTLYENNIELKFINAGLLKRCIIYGINSYDGKKAVNLIYERYL